MRLSGSEKLVIIADDSVRSRRRVRDILHSHSSKTRIDEVNNGADLVEKVRQGNYFLVITDNNMPQLSGVEATARIRVFDPDVPICMITASDSYEEAMRAGVTDYIQRTPRTRVELLEILRQYL